MPGDDWPGRWTAPELDLPELAICSLLAPPVFLQQHRLVLVADEDWHAAPRPAMRPGCASSRPRA